MKQIFNLYLTNNTIINLACDNIHKMIDIKDYMTMMAVGLTDKKTLEEARWGKVKKTARKSYDRLIINYTLTEDDLP